MQHRHSDRRRYFEELANTSRNYYIDYIKSYKDITGETSILEIGCGEGGNLVPFAQMGCKVTGLDISEVRIRQATEFFREVNLEGEFCCVNFLNLPAPVKDEEKYDVILMHDVIEHIEAADKEQFTQHIKKFVKTDGVIFIAFPAWQMPFGGHQQICHSKVCSITPFTHLLPMKAYKKYLSFFGENEACINELMSIKRSKMTIEHFERLCKNQKYEVLDRTLWFVNPHYKEKFGFPALKLNKIIGSIPFIRNYFSTSCFYLLTSSSQ
ncbi:bifunctional 2-polyprenyl-6-hydroxyphenol methylase/3-demethylubiquinol 3-O-methyltransferase UbiG [Porphyromonas sp.]|uniref:class I SAM-dependent methyltransferase n=1 Tax=Porphyromonas sp. TaxID=1924944 RepID=UPI0026DBEFDC|nr:class I SAM-dependent methyltransferase [Porphyromonas sp.]MDO4771813.1 class I SAM-dependent methyltransferase [Porphyromonas sp.]